MQWGEGYKMKWFWRWVTGAAEAERRVVREAERRTREAREAEFNEKMLRALDKLQRVVEIDGKIQELHVEHLKGLSRGCGNV